MLYSRSLLNMGLEPPGNCHLSGATIPAFPCPPGPAPFSAFSMVQSKGCWLSREYSFTWATLDSATSRLSTPQTPRPRVWTWSMTWVAFSTSMAKNRTRTATTKSMGVESSFSNRTEYSGGRASSGRPVSTTVPRSRSGECFRVMSPLYEGRVQRTSIRAGMDGPAAAGDNPPFQQNHRGVVPMLLRNVLAFSTALLLGGLAAAPAQADPSVAARLDARGVRYVVDE